MEVLVAFSTLGCLRYHCVNFSLLCMCKYIYPMARHFQNFKAIKFTTRLFKISYIVWKRAAVKWLKYCRYGVKQYPINQSIIQSINQRKRSCSFLKFYWKIYHVIIDKYNPSWSVVRYHRQNAGIKMHDSLDKKKHIQLQTIAGPYHIFSIIFGGYHPLDKMFIYVILTPIAERLAVELSLPVLTI